MNNKTDNSNYSNDSIVMLKGEERVRSRPAVIFGSDGLEGCEHAFFEILSNSVDEAREGYGKDIEVVVYEDGSFSVKDYGRGIPLDYNKTEKRYNWELVYCEMYAGGKMDRDNYQFSLGLNGLGACATQYCSEYFEVEVVRGGYKYNLQFKHGKNIGGLKKEKTTSDISYTFQHWKPDYSVFTDINIPEDHLLTLLEQQSVVNKGISFHYFNKITKTEKTFCCPDGILGYINNITAGQQLLSVPVYHEKEGVGKDRSDKAEYKVKITFAFCFNNDRHGCLYFHNSSFLENGGSPDKAVKSAFTASIDAILTKQNKYQKGESKITFNDIEDSLLFISSTFSTETSYANQTKKAITNKFIQDYMTDVIKSFLETWFIENTFEAEKVLAQLLANKRSRESAEKQRLNIKKKLVGAIDINNRVEKFVDCRSKDVAHREIYIVEGDSALGSCKLGRDANFQGIMPVRGKILNCLKATDSKIFSSEIITDLVKVLGCGVEHLNKKYKDIPPFDINKLNWNKIIICTDSDIDGFQIRTLILTMIHRLMPSLITKGKVYIAETPLYEITYKGKETFFAFDDREKNAYLKGKDLKKATIQRSKGLGENDPEMMWQTTMNPETRRLIRVTEEDAIKMADTFDLLLGDNLSGRKQFIQENGHLYLDSLDLS